MRTPSANGIPGRSQTPLIRTQRGQYPIEHLSVLLDGEIKKQDAVPPATLSRVRRYQAEMTKRQQAIMSREKKR